LNTSVKIGKGIIIKNCRMIEIASKQIFARNFEEVVSDRLLLLFLVYENRMHGNSVSGNSFERQLKIQKLLFRIEEKMDHHEYKGLNYNFFRWSYGPFAREIYIDTEELVETKFLEVKNKELRLTEKGSKLIQRLLKFFKSDKELIEFYDRSIREFGEYDAEELMKIIKNYPSIEKMPIFKTKKGTPLLLKREELNSKRIFKIPSDLYEELIIQFNPDISQRLSKGLQSVKESPLRKFKPEIRK